jgi:hypothetical protein
MRPSQPSVVINEYYNKYDLVFDTTQSADPRWLGTVAGTAPCFLCRRTYILIVQIWLKYCIWPSVIQTWLQLDKVGMSIEC